MSLTDLELVGKVRGVGIGLGAFGRINEITAARSARVDTKQFFVEVHGKRPLARNCPHLGIWELARERPHENLAPVVW